MALPLLQGAQTRGSAKYNLVTLTDQGSISMHGYATVFIYIHT